MTKQDRALADLMKVVREYNEIDGHYYFELSYLGDRLVLYRHEKNLGYEVESSIDFTKVKYTRGVNMIRAITQEIRKEAERL